MTGPIVHGRTADAPVLREPAGLAETRLEVLREKPRVSIVELRNAALRADQLGPLIEALHHSEAMCETLDLSFNHLGDGGVRLLCETLAREGLAAHDLTHLHLGANGTSPELEAEMLSLLAKQRPDVTVDFETTLRGAKKVLQVGKVFPDSPASAAGLVRGDAIVAIGSYSYAGQEPNRAFKSEAERHLDQLQWFRSVAASLKPLVQRAADKSDAIDVVVERADGRHVPLKLRPAQWAGDGLLGAKIGLYDPPKPDEKLRASAQLREDDRAPRSRE